MKRFFKGIFSLGVGLILEELKNAGFADNTLVMYSSDNGVPFANGRTNLYDSGIMEPLLMSSPVKTHRRNEVTYSLTSLLDVAPTVLDWFGLSASESKMSGKSLLPLLVQGNLQIKINRFSCIYKSSFRAYKY